MLGYLTLIFCCQLLGELVVTALGLPVPGPVLGMALLFAGLLAYGSIPRTWPTPLTRCSAISRSFSCPRASA
jgi:putative effector of murein hydrolase LrgA (UPF0299 family)